MASAIVRANNGHVENAMFSDVPVNYSLFSSFIRRYRNYSLVNAELEKVGHLGQHSTSEQKWNPSNHGDICGSVRVFFGLPGIQRNVATLGLATRQNDAYWCQSVGYALIKEARMIVGNQNMIKSSSRNLYENYQLCCPDAALPIDANICRYQTETQLKAASAGNQILTVPLLMSLLRGGKRPDQAWKIVQLWQVPTELGITLRPLLDVTVNLYHTALVPYLKGTSTVMASSDVSVRVFGQFFILDTDEREQLAYDTYVIPILQTQTFEYTSTEAAAVAITMNPQFNHAARVIKVGFQPTSYTDGTLYSPAGVGMKNYFDYVATHGGESLYELDLKLNAQSVLTAGIPPVELRHHNWVQAYSSSPYQMLYVIPFSQRLNEQDINHTVNLTGFDKVSVICKKNSADSGIIFIECESFNVILASDGHGGAPFGGGA